MVERGPLSSLLPTTWLKTSGKCPWERKAQRRIQYILTVVANTNHPPNVTLMYLNLRIETCNFEDFSNVGSKSLPLKFVNSHTHQLSSRQKGCCHLSWLVCHNWICPTESISIVRFFHRQRLLLCYSSMMLAKFATVRITE